MLTHLVQWCSGRGSCLCAGGYEFETYHHGKLLKKMCNPLDGSLAGCACLPQYIFFMFLFLDFFDLHFAECFSLPSAFCRALGKDVFADKIAAECLC
jgi:hypothetical protein